MSSAGRRSSLMILWQDCFMFSRRSYNGCCSFWTPIQAPLSLRGEHLNSCLRVAEWRLRVPRVGSGRLMVPVLGLCD